MTGKFNNLFLCVFLCCICHLLSAQQYGYVQYNSNNGAPFDKVSSVIQDEAGFIWVGSENGLYRFDGIHFDNYSLHVESQFIHKLSDSGENLLFVNDMSINRIENILTEPTVKTLIEGSINEDDQLPFYPNDLVVGKNGAIWVSQSNHSIGKLDDDEFRSYRFSETDKAQQLAIHEDSEGGIWALSPLDGLFYLDESSDRFEKKLEINNGQSLLIHNEYLLVGSNDLSIYTINNNTPQLLRKIPFNNDLITAIHVDHNGEYLVGSQSGKLFKLSDLDDSPQTIYGANEAHRVEELEFGMINEIFSTRHDPSSNEQLWVSSETGLWLLQKRFFKTVEDLPMNNPIAISLGDQGKAWSPMNYLYEIAPDAAEFSARPILNNMQANAVAQDVSGALWVSTATPKIELLKTMNGNVVKRYDFHDRGEAIFYLYPDNNGNIWFCQAPVNKPIVGIAKIDVNGEVVYYDETKGFTSRVLAVKESSRGEIYAVGIGEESYLYRYDQEEDRFLNLSPPLPFNAMLNFEAHDLTIDNQGVVWMATTDGLLRYDSEKVTLIQNDILKQEEVRGVTHNSDNSIWISTATKGLVYHQQNTSTALGELAGLPAIISAYRCIATDEQGRLWAGTAEGLVYSRMPANSLPLSNPPRLRKVVVDGREVSADPDQVFLLKKNKQLLLDYNNLSFPGKNVEYQYRLLPKEDREIMLEEQLWQSNGNSNVLKLDHKELGNYLLELRARQPGGYQWSNPLEIEYLVFLPWYMKSWFIYGAGGVLVLLVSYYFRSYVRRRFLKLQRVLSISNEKLATKEAQLEQKIREFEVQKEELANASSNIQTLELFTREIPKTASWDDIIAAMGKAVNQAEDINAFEIAFKVSDEIVHRGYSDQERSGYTFRSKPFNIKTSLTCWAMSNNKEVMINDYIREHGMYVQEKPAYRFASLIFVPFQLENDQDVVLCAYSVKENDFDNNDLVMFRILAQFIRFSIHQELTKEL